MYTPRTVSLLEVWASATGSVAASAARRVIDGIATVVVCRERGEVRWRKSKNSTV